MLKSYVNIRASYRRSESQRIAFEGIYMTISSSTGEIMISQVEEILLDENTVS